MAVIEGGWEHLKASGAVKVKPGGIVVVDGHEMSKVEVEIPDGVGIDASVESGAKVIWRENLIKSDLEI